MPIGLPPIVFEEADGSPSVRQPRKVILPAGSISHDGRNVTLSTVIAADVLRKSLTADVTNATATMAGLTGLSVTLAAGAVYVGRLVLYCADDVAADGFKCDFDGGSATMTNIRAHGVILDTALLLSTQVTALATDFSVAVITGNSRVDIDIAMTVNAGGTFIPQFAQAAHTTGTATVYRGSYLYLVKI